MVINAPALRRLIVERVPARRTLRAKAIEEGLVEVPQVGPAQGRRQQGRQTSIEACCSELQIS